MKNLFCLVFLISLLAGCTQSAMKAPCNASGSNCGSKIKINQWDN